jgi:hypothetical protein
MGDVPENFRLFEAGWMEKKPPFRLMEVRGAEFRAAKTGPYKGKLSIMVPGTQRVTYVNKEDMAEFEPKAKKRGQTSIVAHIDELPYFKQSDPDGVIELLRTEFEQLVNTGYAKIDPPCGMANCLKRDQHGYLDRYMQGVFAGFVLARQSRK